MTIRVDYGTYVQTTHQFVWLCRPTSGPHPLLPAPPAPPQRLRRWTGIAENLRRVCCTHERASARCIAGRDTNTKDYARTCKHRRSRASEMERTLCPHEVVVQHFCSSTIFASSQAPPNLHPFVWRVYFNTCLLVRIPWLFM